MGNFPRLKEKEFSLQNISYYSPIREGRAVQAWITFKNAKLRK